MARPVLLVHGIWDTGTRFRWIRPRLERSGLRVHSLNLSPNNGNAELAELARQLDGYVRTTFADVERIDLVAFSMGGLVSRYYIQRLGGMERVGKFVTLGTPHRGTWTAFVLNNAGARDMRPGSAFLEDLNRDVEVLRGVSFTSIWTPLDLMILPAASSHVEVGRSIPVRALMHPLLVRDRRVLQILLGILSES